MDITTVLQQAKTMALDLACEDDEESRRESDLVHRLVEEVERLHSAQVWRWIPTRNGSTLQCGRVMQASVWHTPRGGWAMRDLATGQTTDHFVSEELAQSAAIALVVGRGAMMPGTHVAPKAEAVRSDDEVES